MEQAYRALLEEVLEKGNRRGDRTKTGTISLFGPQIKCQMSDGFPLLTSKKVHWKSVVHELLWFLSGSTNIKYLKDNGVSIWDEWQSFGSIGPGYSHQWRRWEEIRVVSPTRFEPHSQKIGDIAGVGKGCASGGLGVNPRLYSVWSEMLHRCYNSQKASYNSYGKKGVFVDERWLDFSNFVEDACNLENYNLWLEFPGEYELDKDYFATNKYGPDTTLWLSLKENRINTDRACLYEVCRPDGVRFQTMDLAGVCGDYSLDRSDITKNLSGKRSAVKGFTFTKIDTGKDVPRYRCHDQIKSLVANLKKDPLGRRHLVSAWNVSDLSRMELPPCHMMFQCYVEGEYLSLKMYQRSADLFLGVPFNIASYALLLEMLAHTCGLRTGELIISFGDAHIYSNHVDQVKELLSREPRELPSLHIMDRGQGIDDYVFEDFKLEGYNPHPAIKAEVAV